MKKILKSIGTFIGEFVVAGLLFGVILWGAMEIATITHEKSGYCGGEKCDWFWCNKAKL